jgi:oxepin-CoA hydrolase/3-oxo-5,6-dehydrosuberyl-CoA semialdehyde dehydrogenase
VNKLLETSSILYGSLDSVEVLDADPIKGAFVSPLLLLNENPFGNSSVHEVEAFGPVATLMPYKHTEEAISLAKLGKGSLVSSIVTAECNNCNRLCNRGGQLSRKNFGAE